MSPTEKPRTSFSTLPVDLVETILESLSADVDHESDPDAGLYACRTIATIAPTCRCFAAICRKLLYDTPFELWTRPMGAPRVTAATPPCSAGLLRALAQHTAVQDSVRDLRCLDRLTMWAARLTRGGMYRLEAQRLQEDVIRKCKKANRLSVLLSPEYAIDKPAEACAACPELEHLTLTVPSASGSESRRLLAEFMRAFRHASPQPISYLEVSLAAHTCGRECSELARRLFKSAQRIILDLSQASLDVGFTCYARGDPSPMDAGAVKELLVLLHRIKERSQRILDTSGPGSSTLTRLCIAVPSDHGSTLLDDYNTSRSTRPVWPTWAFSAFPELTALVLMGGRGMTLKKLGTLFHHSLKLQKLLLSGTWWDVFDRDVIKGSTDNVSRFELALAELTDLAYELREFNVGELPFTASGAGTPADWPVLRAFSARRRRGCVVSVEPCSTGPASECERFVHCYLEMP